MKMKSLKPKEIVEFLESEYEKKGILTFVDGFSYYEGCGVGGYFYYFEDECLDISINSQEYNLKSLDGKYKVISRKELDDDEKYPIKKGV